MMLNKKTIVISLFVFLLSGCAKPATNGTPVNKPANGKIRCVDLPKKNWAAFAKRYNGKNYKINSYDIKLEREYKKASGCIE